MIYKHHVYYVDSNVTITPQETCSILDRFCYGLYQRFQSCPGLHFIICRHYYEGDDQLSKYAYLSLSGTNAKEIVIGGPDEAYDDNNVSQPPLDYRRSMRAAHCHIVFEWDGKNTRGHRLLLEQVRKQNGMGPHAVRRADFTRTEVRSPEGLTLYLCKEPRLIDFNNITTGARSYRAHTDADNEICECPISMQGLNRRTEPTSEGCSEYTSTRDVNLGRKRSSKSIEAENWKRLRLLITDSLVNTATEVDRIIATADDDISHLQMTSNYERYVSIFLNNAKMNFTKTPWDTCLSFVAEKQYDDCLTPLESLPFVEALLEYNQINIPWFLENLVAILNRQSPKLNSVVFIGPPNAGKTLLGESISRSMIYCTKIQSFSRGDSFYLQDCLHSRCIFLNEPKIDESKFETFKNVLEGQPVNIQVKYKSQQLLERTPCIVATNHPLSCYTRSCEYNELAIKARSMYLHLSKFDHLINCKKFIHPFTWKLMLNKYL